MPQIVVLTDSPQNSGTVVYREKVPRSNMESEYFADQLIERVGWAVSDAATMEQEATAAPSAEPSAGLEDPEFALDDPVRLEAALQPAVSG